MDAGRRWSDVTSIGAIGVPATDLPTIIGTSRTADISIGPGRVEGWAQALDGDGALLVRKDNGQIERIVGGDLLEERP